MSGQVGTRSGGRALPILAFLVAVASFQCGASFATRLFAGVGAEGSTALRVGLAALMLAAVLRPWRAAVPAAARGALLAYGIGLGAMNLSFYLALRTVPLGVAVAIEFWGPLAVALAGSRRPRDLAWIGLAVAGLAVLLPVQGSGAIDPAGAGFALLAGLGWAVYILAGTRAGRLVVPPQVTAIGMVVAALVVVPVGVAHAGAALLAPPTLLAGAGIALLSSAMPYLLEMVVLSRLPSRVYGTLAALDPAAGALAGWALIGQRLTGVQWAGLAAITVAAGGAALAIRPAPAPPGPPLPG